jgi:hypothetical protein
MNKFIFSFCIICSFYTVNGQDCLDFNTLEKIHRKYHKKLLIYNKDKVLIDSIMFYAFDELASWEEQDSGIYVVTFATVIMGDYGSSRIRYNFQYYEMVDCKMTIIFDENYVTSYSGGNDYRYITIRDGYLMHIKNEKIIIKLALKDFNKEGIHEWFEEIKD